MRRVLCFSLVCISAAMTSESSLEKMLLRRESSAVISPLADVGFTDPQPSTCKLPPAAQIGEYRPTQTPTACAWIPQQQSTNPGSCIYDLAGTCKQHFDPTTGCNFWGWPQNEVYAPAELFLPGPAPGEFPLTENETKALMEPFQPCDSRPRMYLVSVPPIASADAPLAVLSGGSPNMQQHVYFVANEICIGCPGGDSYRLGLQTEEDMKVVVDVGANIGYFSIAVCKRWPKARIIAFEPHPANYRFLKANLLAAGCADRVEAYNQGLSRDGRNMKLFWHDSIGTSAYRDGDNYVPMRTMTPDGLRQILGADTIVTFFKIDCEGCEYEVVPLLQKQWVQKMFCEVHGATVQTDVAKETIDDVEKSCRGWNPQNHTIAA